MERVQDAQCSEDQPSVSEKGMLRGKGKIAHASGEEKFGKAI